MAIRKTASKKSSKAKLNIEIDKPNKRTRKKTIKGLKKLGAGTIALSILLLSVGAGGGYFVTKHLTQNDCFEIVGQDEITLTIGEGYTDEGVKVVAFGKDESSKVKVATNLTQKEDGKYYADEEGTFYISYTVDNIKYGSIFKIQKVRLINFVEPPEQEEIDKNKGGENE